MGASRILYMPGLDVLKYVMALLIVASHCNLFEEWSGLCEVFAHITESAANLFCSFCIFVF